MKSIHRSALALGVSSLFLWSGFAAALPNGHQHHGQVGMPGQQGQGLQGQQGQQGQQVQKVKRVAFVLAYMRWKKGEALTLRDLVKAKLVTEKVRGFVEDLKQAFEDSDADVQDLADRLQIKIEEYQASTDEEQAEVQTDSTMLQRLQAIAADRDGEQELLVAVRDWADGLLERIEALRAQVESEDATPVLDRFQSRIQDLRDRADALIED